MIETSPKILYAEFTARPGAEEAVLQLLRELTEQVRSEPGNVVFDAYQLDEAPHRFFVYEIYRDDDAFRQHISREHSAAFNAALASLIVEEASTLTWLRPVLS